MEPIRPSLAREDTNIIANPAINNKILVQDAEPIMDEGTQAELVARLGVYQKLTNAPFKSASEQALEALFA